VISSKLEPAREVQSLYWSADFDEENSNLSAVRGDIMRIGITTGVVLAEPQRKQGITTAVVLAQPQPKQGVITAVVLAQPQPKQGVTTGIVLPQPA
jgi:hypothetical protein